MCRACSGVQLMADTKLRMYRNIQLMAMGSSSLKIQLMSFLGTTDVRQSGTVSPSLYPVEFCATKMSARLLNRNI